MVVAVNQIYRMRYYFVCRMIMSRSNKFIEVGRSEGQHWFKAASLALFLLFVLVAGGVALLAARTEPLLVLVRLDGYAGARPVPPEKRTKKRLIYKSPHYDRSMHTRCHIEAHYRSQSSAIRRPAGCSQDKSKPPRLD